MSIKSYVEELGAIKEELKKMTKARKVLTLRTKELEKNIAVYLKSKDQPGVKHEGNAIILEEKENRAPKKTGEKDSDASEILKKYGIQEPLKVLNEILEARKGEKILTEKVTMTKYKKEK